MHRSILFVCSLGLLAARPAAAQATAGPSTSALMAATDDILRQVQALRGLRAKSMVARGVLSRPQISEKLRAHLDEEYTPAEVDAETRVLRRLGLLPAGLDYGKLLVELLVEQVAGFYDPKAKKLFIADWLPLDLQKPAMAHELEHALQDQNFDLVALMKPLKTDGDRQLAHAALVEGDGTALMLEMQAQQAGLPTDQLPDLVATMGEAMVKAGQGGASGQTPQFDKAPPFVRESMLFPYFAGLRFVMAMRRGNSWKKIDELFRSPPSSTEQILHPDRYLAHDEPTTISDAPLTSLAPKKHLRSDVVGELSLRLLFRSRLPEAQADAAAEGWGGDRLLAYASDAKGSAPTVVLMSSWDTETDASEAELAFRELFRKLAGQPSTAAATAAARFVDPNGEVWRVERRDRSVLCLMGVPANDAPIATEAWTVLRPVAPRRP